MEFNNGVGMHNLAYDLPMDLWDEILSHLESDSSAVNKVCRLARSWHLVAMPHLYRHVELRDPRMKAQIRFLQTLEDNPHLGSMVRTLKVGICPPSHEHGDFIYDLAEALGILINLECLELLRIADTPQDLYSVEGNGNTIMRRYWRGEVGKIPSEDPTYPQLLFFRVDIPMGYTIYSIFQAQRRLQSLELRYPSHFYRHEDVFVSPYLRKLAISGESILTTLPDTFKPTHLLLDCPASTPLWPSRFRKTQTEYLAMPSTHHLRSLEISSTLADELQLCIDASKLTFPSLLHFGIFTSERVDERFLHERQFLLMWSGARRDPAKRMLELFRHFPHLESVSVMPEGVSGDWADSILTDRDLLRELMGCCPELKLLLWRAHAGQKAGTRLLKGEGWNSQRPTGDSQIQDYWGKV